MCKIIAIANQKGGVAKTTTTINLGVGLSKVGKRVMLIDADPQGHLTMGLGFPKNLRVTLKTMMENIIMGLEFDPREAILHHEEGIDVIPSNKLLSGMDMSLFTVEDREKVLKEYLELLENDYDYILIDCMPSLGMMTINALSAADSVLIPVQPQYYAADGLMELLKVVKGIHQRFNPDLQIEKIRYFRKQRGLSQELLAERTGINVNTIRKYEIGIRKPKVEQLKKIADGLEISVIEFLDIEIENEADLIAMLKKISPFFKWDGLLHVLEGEKFL